jgi:hypothetical protein
MGWACSIRQINWSEYTQQRYHVEHLIIRKMIILKRCGICYEGLNWIPKVQARIQWRAVVNTVTNMRFHNRTNSV